MGDLSTSLSALQAGASQMRKTLAPVIEGGRFWGGDYASKPGDMHGVFCLGELVVMSAGADSHYGWEHVSVSCVDRTPTWTEMCFVKDLFWRDDETVVQYHPRKQDYVNHHACCRHL